MSAISKETQPKTAYVVFDVLRLLLVGGCRVASHDDREHAIPIDLWRLGHPPSSCGAGAMAGMRL